MPTLVSNGCCAGCAHEPSSLKLALLAGDPAAATHAGSILAGRLDPAQATVAP